MKSFVRFIAAAALTVAGATGALAQAKEWKEIRIGTEGAHVVPLMRHVRLLAVVTTCGAPFWISWLMGQPGRRIILRGIRALCAPRVKTLYLAHYLMDRSTPDSRATYLEKVRRKLSKV